MHFFLARPARGDIRVFHAPIKLQRNPHVSFTLPLAQNAYITDLPPHGQLTNLHRHCGALLDVQLTPRPGYLPLRFHGCEEGVAEVFGNVLPNRISDNPMQQSPQWEVYVKVLKVEKAPIEVTV